MSHLTRCNYCVLKDLKRHYKNFDFRTVKGIGDWTGWVIVEKREKVPRGEAPRPWHDAGHKFGALTDHCVC